jgi:hypothetical protein
VFVYLCGYVKICASVCDVRPTPCPFVDPTPKLRSCSIPAGVAKDCRMLEFLASGNGGGGLISFAFIKDPSREVSGVGVSSGARPTIQTIQNREFEMTRVTVAIGDAGKGKETL